MRGRLLRYIRDRREPTGGVEGSLSRRRFLITAGAGGVGLGAVGARMGETSDNGPASRNGTSTTDGPDAASTDGVGDTTETESETGGSTDLPVIGANLNGRPRRLQDNLGLVDASGTRWIRAFVDVRKKLADGGDPDADPDVLALRQAARERDCSLVISLKWDFTANWGDKEPTTVPPAGSAFDRDLRQCALQYLRSIGPAVVVLGNEPMWETQGEDIRGDDPPIVRFTRDLKDYLVGEGDLGDPTYLVGALNRIHDDTLREEWFPQFYRRITELVRDDEDVEGVDLHLHYDDLSEAEEMVAVVREDVPDGTITATEFSPVWRYDRYKEAAITESEAGRAFARAYDLPDAMTAVEYFQYAKRNPRPPAELADFYDAMPWYNVDHVADVFDMFEDYDVTLGTFGFLQGLGMRQEDWTAGWTPFHINFLFQPALMRTEDGLAATAHPHYIEDYRERATREPPRLARGEEPARDDPTDRPSLTRRTLR